MLHNCGHRSTSAYPCSCGFLCGAGGCGGAAATLSFLFPASGKPLLGEAFDATNSTTSSYSSSLVDCTLSLGTPSTRQTEYEAASSQIQRRSCMSSFCWDIISQTKKSSPTVGPDGGATRGSLSEGDPLLAARRCANCDTTSTPLWRNGPRGPKSLCNACGIRYKKEERRAAASTVQPSSALPAAAEQGISCGYHRQQPSPWSYYSAGAIRSSSSISGYDEKAGDGDVSCLSWRLNVVPSAQFQVRERHGLFQYN